MRRPSPATGFVDDIADSGGEDVDEFSAFIIAQTQLNQNLG